MLRSILATLCLGIFMSPITNAVELSSFTLSDTIIKQSPNDDRHYKLITLNNALQVLLISDPDLENSAVSLSVPIGSMHNPDSQLGLAHYLEHMLFLGSERYPTINEYSKFMSQNGGYTNAYTSQDSTVYGFEVNDKVFDEGLDRLGDVMRAPLLDEKYADKERHTVHAEHKTYVDNDMRKLYALQRYTLNPEHPMARFSTGDLTTLVDKENSKLQVELIDFFNQHYSANTMKVALTSPRSIKELAELASLYLTQIPNKKSKKPIILTPLLSAKELAIKVEMKPTADIKLLQVNFLVPTMKAEYMYQPGSYISRLLGSDHEGGLSDSLIKAGLVDSVMAGFSAQQSEFHSNFSLQFKLTNKGLEAQDKIMNTLFTFIALIKQSGINEIQFNEQKTSLDTHFKFLTKRAGFNYVMGLSASMQHYPIKDILYFPYRLDGFNAKFIHQLLTYLTPENSRLFMLSPMAKSGEKIPYYKGEYTVEKISNKKQKEWLANVNKMALALPTKNIWRPENLTIVKKQHNGKAIQLIKEQGHTVWFAQSAQLEEPKASFKLQLNSDLNDQSATNRIMMNLLLVMLNKQFSELNFVTNEAGLNFSIAASDGLLISTSGYSDKQDKLLLNIVEHISNTQFSEQSLRLAGQEILRRLNNKNKIKVMSLAFDSFRKVVRQPAWSDDTLKAAISTITIKDIEQFRDKIFKQSTLRLLALGNFTQEQVLAVDKRLTKKISVQNKDFYTINRLQADLQQGPLNYAVQSEMPDDALLMVHLSPLKGKQALAISELLNKLVQPAFYDQIRTQEQLSYSPFSASFNVNDHVAFALFTQSSVASNSELHARFKQFLVDFKEQLTDITEDKFSQIKETHIANYTAKATSLQDEFSYLSSEWLMLKAQINSKKHYIDLLSAVSLEQVKAFYNDLLITDKKRQIIAVQVQGEKFIDRAPLSIENQVQIKNIDNLVK